MLRRLAFQKTAVKVDQPGLPAIGTLLQQNVIRPEVGMHHTLHVQPMQA